MEAWDAAVEGFTEASPHLPPPCPERADAMKYVLVSGGVVSGLGKGVTASSIGVLLKACGLRVTSIKIGGSRAGAAPLAAAPARRSPPTEACYRRGRAAWEGAPPPWC